MNARTALWPLVVVIGLGLLIQMFMPVASDEAYFISWGNAFYAGVYDHPPLTGWIAFAIRALAEFLGLSSTGLLHRLFSTLLGLAALWLIAVRIRRTDAEPVNALVAYAVVPGSILMYNLYLNDTLVGFFALVFVLAVDLAMRATRNQWLAIVLAGLSFAALLLSKYNGAVVYLGVVLALLTWPKYWGFLFRQMVLISLVALGPFLWHLWWNYTHCSVNLAFNFGFRKEAATGFGALWLVLTLVLMAGSAGILTLWHVARAERFGFFARTFFAVLAVMLAIAIWRGEFGINWGTPLGGLAVLALAEIKPDAMRLAGKSGAFLSAMVLLPVIGLIAGIGLGAIPAERILSDSQINAVDRILDLDDGQLPTLLLLLSRDRTVIALDYGTAASLENSGMKDVSVFSRSIYGRNQDLYTDFRALDGRDMLILPQQKYGDRELADTLFDSYEIHQVKTSRQTYEIILGQGFSYDAYRRDWIMPVITTLYENNPFPYRSCGMDFYR